MAAEQESESHRQRLEAEAEALHQRIASESEKRAELEWRLEEAEKTIQNVFPACSFLGFCFPYESNSL